MAKTEPKTKKRKAAVSEEKKNKYTCTEKDNELLRLIESLKSDELPMSAAERATYRQIAVQLQSMRQSLGLSSTASQGLTDFGDKESKLTTDVKSKIRTLVVDDGANLNGIDALHHAAAWYREQDLFDLLVDEYGMSMESFDDNGRRPIHIAAGCGNTDAIRILLAKGADKNGRNVEGQTALQEASKKPVGCDAFMWELMRGRPEFIQVRGMLS
jgi:hypothetical protein